MEQLNHEAVQPTPAGIMQIGMGFWASKTLLTAVKFELFTKLALNEGQSAAEIKSALGLGCTERHAYDFLDTLASFGFLQREGLLESARYSNSADSSFFLDKRKSAYMGGLLEMANDRLYGFWGTLEDGLKTGLPQNEARGRGDNPFFSDIYKSPEKLNGFINAMTGIQMGNFDVFAQKMDFSSYKTLSDIGGSGAMLSIMVAKHQPHMQCISFDLPPVEPIAKGNISHFNLSDRIKTVSGNFFENTLPAADVVVMGNILHDWDEENKVLLMKKAFEALPANGAFVAIESIIDEERSQNKFGLMMSLNMLIETGKGFDYSFSDFNKWALAAGFRKTALLPLTGPSSACIAYK
jgi:hypothetical protein